MIYIIPIDPSQSPKKSSSPNKWQPNICSGITDYHKTHFPTLSIQHNVMRKNSNKRWTHWKSFIQTKHLGIIFKIETLLFLYEKSQRNVLLQRWFCTISLVISYGEICNFYCSMIHDFFCCITQIFLWLLYVWIKT